MKFLTSVLSTLFPPQPGQSDECPLELQAVPGLTTLLDLALFQANEGQLTGTICSSHALLACWLDMKHVSQVLLKTLIPQENDSFARVQCESLARQCLESSMDAIERLSTELMAESANLTDPYESISSQRKTGSFHHHNANALLSGVGAQGITSGILEAKDETGRRIPWQRRKDCWESPRLICPDYVWADDLFSACQRWIRSLAKHPFVILRETDAALSPLASGAVTSTTSAATTLSSSFPSSLLSSNPITSLLLQGTSYVEGSSTGKSNKQYQNHMDRLSYATEFHVSLLVQLIQDDIPLRLFQFRQAMEAEAVVTKRLYLVKSEYRAPFRAFLESHQTLLRAPPMDLVESYLQQQQQRRQPGKKPSTTTATTTSSTGDKQHATAFQKLLETPALVELLALERECEQLELDLGQTLFPFTELARTLDHKKARLKVIPGVLEEDQLADLQETVRRLKCILCRRAGSETSTGIRPLLLDLQGVPRDDEATLSGKVNSAHRPTSFSSLVSERVEDFLWQLECLSNLAKTKNAFWTIKSTAASSSSSSSSNNLTPTNTNFDHHHVEFNASIIKGCTEQFDKELLKCQLLDWCTMVERQCTLQSMPDVADLPETIRQAEITMSIAGASEQSLQLVQERLQKMQLERQQRLEVLTEVLEDLCLREMNLFIRLSGPDPTQTLQLNPTSALGFLGIPLQMAGESLPIG